MYLKLFIILFSIQVFSQTTYYVSDSHVSASDANAGTSTSAPWKTLSKLRTTSFSAGDIIRLKRGDTWANQYLQVSSSGTSGNLIRVATYDTGDMPIIQGGTSANLGGYFTGAYVRYDSLHFQGTPTGAALGGSTVKVVLITGRGVQVKECLIEGDTNGSPNRADAGIIFTSRDVVIDSNEVRHALRLIHSSYSSSDSAKTMIRYNYLHATTQNNDGDCIKFSGGGNTAGTTISHNEMTDWANDAIDGRGQYLLVEHNLFHSPKSTANCGIAFKRGTGIPEQSMGGVARYNTLRDFNITTPYFSTESAITIASSKTQVYGNLIYNIGGTNGAIGINISGVAADGGNPDSLFVFNNTVITSTQHAISVDNGAVNATNIMIRNNIVKGNNTSASRDIYYGAGVVLSTNNVIVNNNTATKLASVTSANNLTGTPDFTNSAGGDFSLTADDVLARDNGFNVSSLLSTHYYSYPAEDIIGTSVPQNTDYDIGAYEYTGEVNYSPFVVIRGSASNITTTTADVTGVVEGKGLSTVVRFLRTTSNVDPITWEDTTLAVESPVSDSTDVTGQFTGMTPGTNQYWTIECENDSGIYQDPNIGSFFTEASATTSVSALGKRGIANISFIGKRAIGNITHRGKTGLP